MCKPHPETKNNMKYIVSERFLGALQDYELLGRPAVRWDLSRMTPLRENAAVWLLGKGCDYERGVLAPRMTCLTAVVNPGLSDI